MGVQTKYPKKLENWGWGRGLIIAIPLKKERLVQKGNNVRLIWRPFSAMMSISCPTNLQDLWSFFPDA